MGGINFWTAQAGMWNFSVRCHLLYLTKGFFERELADKIKDHFNKREIAHSDQPSAHLSLQTLRALSPDALDDKTFTSGRLCSVNFVIAHNKTTSLTRKIHFHVPF